SDSGWVCSKSWLAASTTPLAVSRSDDVLGPTAWLVAAVGAFRASEVAFALVRFATRSSGVALLVAAGPLPTRRRGTGISRERIYPRCQAQRSLLAVVLGMAGDSRTCRARMGTARILFVHFPRDGWAPTVAKRQWRCGSRLVRRRTVADARDTSSLASAA